MVRLRFMLTWAHLPGLIRMQGNKGSAGPMPAPIFLLAGWGQVSFSGVTPERAATVVGGISQIAGFGLVVYMVFRMERDFGAPSLLVDLRNRIVRGWRLLVRTYRRLLKKPQPVSLTSRLRPRHSAPWVTSSARSMPTPTAIS